MKKEKQWKQWKNKGNHEKQWRNNGRQWAMAGKWEEKTMKTVKFNDKQKQTMKKQWKGMKKYGRRRKNNEKLLKNMTIMKNNEK